MDLTIIVLLLIVVFPSLIGLGASIYYDHKKIRIAYKDVQRKLTRTEKLTIQHAQGDICDEELEKKRDLI